jgi:hypothetical protein
VLRLCDLLAVAVEDMRQGGDPRLPLELALVKVTRPAADLSRESTAHRLELLERGAHSGHVPPVSGTDTGTDPGTDAGTDPGSVPGDPAEPSSLELEQLQEAWQRTILPAVEEKSIPTASVLREAHPKDLADDTLTVEFPRTASFHRELAEEPKNATLLAEALYEVTGRHLAVAFEVGESGEEEAELAPDEPVSEEEIIELMKGTFDAREVSDE